MSNIFRYQPFVEVSANLRGDVPVVDKDLSSNEQKHPKTLLHEKFIKFVFQTNRNYYIHSAQAYLDLKLIFVKGLGYEAWNTKEKNKKNRE